MPIEAGGWLYINCIWVSGSLKGHGYSSELLSECIRDAKEQGKKGICILCAEGRKREFLADPKFLKYKGFKVADISDCGINLMYLPLAENADQPRFKDCARHPKVSETGFVLYYTDQCPFTYYWVPKVLEAAKEHGISFQAFHITDKEAAQNVPAPVTTYAGENAYLLIENMIRTDTAFTFNRMQLIILTVVLTIAASILAAVGSGYFTKPIFAIKHTVDRLAENDFSARADVNRQDELGELAESVGLLGQALARVDVLRKEVIANVSHELRSPLSVISGYAELVRDIHWKDEAARNEDLDLIIEESNRMSEMVNDILDYSQLQSGYIRLRPESFDFTGLAESETSHCAAAAATYGIQVRFEAPKESVFIYADPLKLSQVLRNLLYNAINHTPEGDTITVSLESKGSHTVRLSVTNPGTPISEEDKKIIWERYQRSQHQSGRRMGTGIGLSIVSTILNAQIGRAHV